MVDMERQIKLIRNIFANHERVLLMVASDVLELVLD